MDLDKGNWEYRLQTCLMGRLLKSRVNSGYMSDEVVWVHVGLCCLGACRMKLSGCMSDEVWMHVG